MIVLLLVSRPLMGQSKAEMRFVVEPEITWYKQTGVDFYRLQIAADEQFRDVRLDRLMKDRQYRPAELVPGRYFWRVAPAQNETGTFIKPIPFEVSFRPPVASKPVQQSGWLAAIGPVVELQRIESVAGNSPTLIAVNSSNTVYALDGLNGVARWTVRFGSSELKTGETVFSPLIVRNRTPTPIVIVSFGNETRGLDSLSGRTLWSTRLTGVPTSGIVVEGQESAVYLVAAKTDQVFLLDTLSGQLKRETKLAYRPIGPPVSFPGRGFLLPFREGSIELFGLDGESVRRFALGRELTTLPVVAETSRGSLVLVGTRDGLLSLDLKSGQFIDQTSLGNGDYPIGVLSLSAETAKANELFLITSGGKVAAIDLRANTIKWMVSAPTRTGILYVADVNGDGQADVVLPGAESFAVALSGVDGSLVSSTDTLRQTVGRAAPRLLLASRLGERRILVSGNDPGDGGVRGMELHATAVGGNRN